MQAYYPCSHITTGELGAGWYSSYYSCPELVFYNVLNEVWNISPMLTLK